MRAVKDIGKALLPDPVVRKVQHALAVRAEKRAARTKAIDLSRAELIRAASLEELSDPSYLEESLLPRLGLNDENLHEIPESLHQYTGYGLLHWQYPNQFSRYLADLSRREIESYLEIGVRHGGTFVITLEYLRRFHPVRRAVGIDLGGSPSLQQYAATQPGVDVLIGSSQGGAFRTLVRDHEPFDLALIDGDHSEEGCRADFELVRDRARIIVLHDIVSHPVPGVGKVWREMKESHGDRFDFLEYTDQYPEHRRRTGVDYFGIGVAVSRSS